MEREEIIKLLQEAENLKQTVSTVEAIKKLEEAKKLVPKLVAIDAADRRSDKNVTQNKAAQEIIYLQKRGHILYELQDYAEAYVAFVAIKKKIPNNTLVYKACGDCMRKQKKYEEALKEYEHGVEVHNSDDCADPLEKSKLLNSKGLVFLELQKYEQAHKDFSEAIEITNGKNPLYFCNRGTAAYSLGKKEEGLKDFKEAKKLVDANNNLETVAELTTQNIEYIKKTLSQFITDLEKIGKVGLKRQDSCMASREAYFVKITMENITTGDNTFGDDAGSGEDLVQQIIKAKKLLSDIEDDPLYEYYEAFVFTLSQNYQVAVAINAKIFKLDISTGKEVDILAKVVSFIPGIGNTLSEGIKSAAELLKEGEIHRGAVNMTKCAPKLGDFEGIIQDLILEVINEREQQIKKIVEKNSNSKPDEMNKFQELLYKFKELQKNIEDEFYGTRNETPLQKLGCENATLLASDFIASGKAFEGCATPLAVRKQLKAILIKATIELIDKGLSEEKVKVKNTGSKKAAEPKKSQPAQKNEKPAQQNEKPAQQNEKPAQQAGTKKTARCQMF